MVEHIDGPSAEATARTRELRIETRALRQELALASGLGRTFGRVLTSAFVTSATGGRKLGDVMRSVLRQLSQATLRAALKPIQGAISKGIGGIFRQALGFASGGAVRRGMPVPFARGGVIGSPTAFPLAGGRLGVAGERGPEAILPLSRGSDGRLGVRTDATARPIAINFNVTTPDAESFQRSESQITAMLSRAVARGERNL